MRYLILIPIYLFMVSCEEGTSARRTNSITIRQLGSFSSYVMEFDRHYQQYNGQALPINELQMLMVDDLGSGSSTSAIANCNIVTKQMKVLRSSWAVADAIERKLIIFHELGHCYLNRGHKIKSIGNMPVSIMYPDVRTRHFYADFEYDYIEELFTERDSQFSSIARNYALDTKDLPQVEHNKFCNHDH